MQLDIISPEATLFSGEVTSVTAPGKDGSFQILENHAPIVSVLQAGQLRIQGFVGELPKSAAALFQKSGKRHVRTVGIWWYVRDVSKQNRCFSRRLVSRIYL